MRATCSPRHELDGCCFDECIRSRSCGSLFVSTGGPARTGSTNPGMGSGKPGEQRKGKDVISVRQTSCIGELAVAVTISVYMPINEYSCEQKSLDNSRSLCIIILTALAESDSGIEHAIAKAHRQAKGVTATGHTESSSPECATSSFPRRRFLRPGRYDSGQVRDAPTGPCRQSASFSGSPRIWAFPAVVLPGQRGLRAGWPIRPDTAEARAQKRSQTHAGSNGIRSGKANIGSVAQFPSIGGSREGGFQRSGSHEQNQATASEGKK